jgi:hypothetical protein
MVVDLQNKEINNPSTMAKYKEGQFIQFNPSHG